MPHRSQAFRVAAVAAIALLLCPHAATASGTRAQLLERDAGANLLRLRVRQADTISPNLGGHGIVLPDSAAATVPTTTPTTTPSTTPPPVCTPYTSTVAEPAELIVYDCSGVAITTIPVGPTTIPNVSVGDGNGGIVSTVVVTSSNSRSTTTAQPAAAPTSAATTPASASVAQTSSPPKATPTNSSFAKSSSTSSVASKTPSVSVSAANAVATGDTGIGSHGLSKTTIAAIGGAAGGGGGLVLLLLMWWCCRRRRSKIGHDDDVQWPEMQYSSSLGAAALCPQDTHPTGRAGVGEDDEDKAFSSSDTSSSDAGAGLALRDRRQSAIGLAERPLSGFSEGRSPQASLFTTRPELASLGSDRLSASAAGFTGVGSAGGHNGASPSRHSYQGPLLRASSGHGHGDAYDLGLGGAGFGASGSARTSSGINRFPAQTSYASHASASTSTASAAHDYGADEPTAANPDDKVRREHIQVAYHEKSRADMAYYNSLVPHSEQVEHQSPSSGPGVASGSGSRAGEAGTGAVNAAAELQEKQGVETRGDEGAAQEEADRGTFADVEDEDGPPPGYCPPVVLDVY